MTTPDSNQTSTWTRWNTAASVLLSLLVLSGIHAWVTPATYAQASENTASQGMIGHQAVIAQNANIVDDIEDILEDILDILDGDKPKDPPAGE